MAKAWVVIASPRMLHIYSANQNGKEIKLYKELDHPESRLIGVELSPDATGCYHVKETSLGVTDNQSPKDVENEHLACQLAEELDAGRLRLQYERVLVFANPQFFAAFQRHSSHDVLSQTTFIPKDYSNLPVDAIPEAIRDYLH